MLVDYHVHTFLCGHATGDLVEYVKEAERKGISEIGFSDHIMVDRWRTEYAMKLSQLEQYVRMVEDVAKESSIPVRIGAEIDYFASKEAQIEAILDEFSFDYALGAVHFIDGWAIDDPRYIREYLRRDINEIYERYFSLVSKMASSGLFDIVAHFDLVKKFGFRPSIDIYYLVNPILERIKVKGLCIEINTSGIEKPVKEFYPDKEILKICRKMEIPITLGSDSHRPEEVGRYFEKAVFTIKEAGYGEIASFCGRRMRLVRL